MLPCGSECPTGDPENPEDAHKAESCWLNAYDSAYRDSTKQQAEVLMNQHLQDDYGTTDKLTVVGIWLSNPTDPLLVEGWWGYPHAALSLIKLTDAQANGATNAELIQLASDEQARWYLWEAKPRCNGTDSQPAVEEWQDPNNWYEDSHLDYYTPMLFIEWWLSTL